MERLTKKYNKYGKPYCFNCEEEVRFDNDIVKKALYKLGNLEDLEEELDVDLIEFLSESIYVLKHCNQIRGYTSKGKEIATDFGYVEEFIEDLKAAIKDKGEQNG